MALRAQSLRDRQVGRCTTPRPHEADADPACTAAIQKILNLNHDPPEDAEARHDGTASSNGLVPKTGPLLDPNGEPIWKVLVFDNLGRDVISSVLRVSDLRAWGVTIHLWVGSRVQHGVGLVRRADGSGPG